jgi:hypothetical protein
MLEILDTIKQKNELLYYFGWLCVLGSIITAVLTQTTSTEVLGINAYIKPMKFFISTVLFVWTFGFYMQYLNYPTAIKIFNWIAIIGLGFELVAITMQAAKGKLSHFNISTSFDAMLFSMMAGAITIVMLAALYIGVLFFVQKSFEVSMLIIWSIRLSIIITVIFAFEGFAMGAMLKHTIGAADGAAGLPIVNWSKSHGDLRVAHFLGLHAIQIVPLLCYYLAKSTWHVIIISCIYLFIVTGTLIQAIMGKPLF